MKWFNNIDEMNKEAELEKKRLELFKNLNFNHTIIGGSFALKQFLRAPWIHKDIDIFMRLDDEEFNEETNKFAKDNNAILVSSPNEDYDYATFKHVLEIKTYKVPDMNTPIQFIQYKKESGSSMISAYAKTVDLPACVSFTIEDDEKIFHIPERALNALFTKRISERGMWPHRMDIYKKRGFKYYR